MEIRVKQSWVLIIFMSISTILTVAAADQLPRAPRGIQNIGNSCYMNASIQCLYQLKSLTGLMLSDRVPYNPNTLGNAYQAFVKEYSQPVQTDLNPASLYKHFPEHLAGGEQQDAQEATSYLIDKLQENQSTEVISQALPFTFGTYDTFTCELCKSKRIGGRVAQNRLLAIPLTDEAFLLSDLLDAYFAPTDIQGMRCTNLQCPSRGEPSLFKKQIYLEELPQVLCIGLKRFDATGRKLLNSIALPHHGLELSGYCSSCPHEIKQQSYSLESVVLHSGSGISGGHYVAVVRHADRWYFCNDTEIRALTQQELDTLLNTGSLTIVYEDEANIDGKDYYLPWEQQFHSYLIFYSRNLSPSELNEQKARINTEQLYRQGAAQRLQAPDDAQFAQEIAAEDQRTYALRQQQIQEDARVAQKYALAHAQELLKNKPRRRVSPTPSLD